MLSADDLQNTGATELGKALRMLAPSFNFSATTVSDGTDLIRPATLRGLGPDQVLVLVNGKRGLSALLSIRLPHLLRPKPLHHPLTLATSNGDLNTLKVARGDKALSSCGQG